MVWQSSTHTPSFFGPNAAPSTISNLTNSKIHLSVDR